MAHNKVIPEQRQVQRLLYSWLLLIGVLRAWEGLLLGQLADGPLLHVGADNALWLYWLSGWPHLMQQYPLLGWLLDFSWLGAMVCGWHWPRSRWAAVIVSFLTVHYYLYYISVATHHEHTLLGIIFCLPLLWAASIKRFVLLLVWLRYYVLWVMVSAAGWKIYRGSWLLPHQMAEILTTQHLSYLVQYPDALFSRFIHWLIAHPSCAHPLWCLGWMIEGSFVLGFFTRRWDHWLGLLFLGFFVADYALMGINFWEFCIFALVFYPWKRLWDYYYLLINIPQISNE